MTDLLPVLNLVPDDGTDGCSFWRVWRPISVLEGLGYPTGWDRIGNDRAGAVLHRYRMIVNQRAGWTDPADGRAFIDALHQGGLVVAQELDDDAWRNRDDQLSEEEMGVTSGVVALTPEQNRASTMLYDGVIVSTERLRTVLHSFAPDMPCEVVGNYIDLDLWAALLAGYERHPVLAGKVTIGWFGGQRRDKDLAVVAEAWRRIAGRFPAVQFVVQGFLPAVIKDVIPPARLHVLPWLPVIPKDDKPFYGVGILSIDIACCSVADTMFNAAKTPCKLLEATAGGAAVVVSDTLYGPLVDHGEDGYVCETADDWERALASLVTNGARRKRMHAAMYAKVKARWALADNVWRWPAAWARLHAAKLEAERNRVWVAAA